MLAASAAPRAPSVRISTSCSERQHQHPLSVSSTSRSQRQHHVSPSTSCSQRPHQLHLMPSVLATPQRHHQLIVLAASAAPCAPSVHISTSCSQRQHQHLVLSASALATSCSQLQLQHIVLPASASAHRALMNQQQLVLEASALAPRALGVNRSSRSQRGLSVSIHTSCSPRQQHIMRSAYSQRLHQHIVPSASASAAPRDLSVSIGTS